MALVSNTNVSTATHGGAAVIWNAIATMVAAGWFVVASDDSAGNPIADAASMNGGTNAWVVVEDPEVGRQFLFIRGANNYTWTIRYSRAGAFSGGSTGTPPTAADQQNLLNGVSLFPATAGSYVGHAVADDEAQTAVAPVYPFWFGASVVSPGSPTWSGGMIFAPIDDGAAPENADPCVMKAANSTNWYTSASWAAWSRYGLSGASWLLVVRTVLGSFGTTADAYGRGIVSLPAVFFQSGGGQVLGLSSWVQIVDQASISYPDTRDLVSGPAWVFAGGLILPWPTGVTPAV